MAASETEQPSKPEQSPPAKKSGWEAVLTATPVVLTVVATILAGLSTSEMTLAQYHRSLAAQNQSKASDQWGFFQAKRLRGTAMENAFDLLPPKARPEKIEADDLEAASRHLTLTLQRAGKEATKFSDAAEAQTKGADGEPVLQETTKLKKTFQASAQLASVLDQQLHKELAKEEMRTAFEYLSVKKLPEVEDDKWENAEINHASQAIVDRIDEKELEPILRRISPADLQHAIGTAEKNARRFEEAGKPVSKSLDQLGDVVNQQVSIAASFHKAVGLMHNVAANASTQTADKSSLDPQSAVNSLDQSDAAVQAAAEDLDHLFKAGRFSYNARRQRRESDYHLKTAGLYEVQVRLSSFTSDRHRTRSKLFFFGMLAAQAGVTIASLSLAVHKRNILWALAGSAGLAAVIFSGYVYLYM
ncbi:MAG TPA: DUF4337 family protein [Gemmataceae bacterium]|jgi:hypothetical protein|nr:DUF4337 family protein [Gemmataceae bacterium]